MDMGDILLEGAIFKMKKTLTGFKWKKKWVRTDGIKMLQWATDVKPGPRTKPKHAFLLADCSVREITANKPNAFCVHETSRNDMNVFATKNRQQLNQWLNVLCQSNTHRVVVAPTKETEEVNPKSPEPLPEETETISRKNLAIRYFEEYDINSQSSKKKVAIDEKLFPNMMNYIGINLSNSDLFFSLQSLKNEKGNIYLSDFLMWLEQHPELQNSDNEDDERDGYDFVNNFTSTGAKHQKKVLSFECDELLRLNHSGSTWLNILEPVHIAGMLDVNKIDLVKSSSAVIDMQHNMPEISDVIKSWPMNGTPKDWNIHYQNLLESVTDCSTVSSKITSTDFSQLYELCSCQSHFVQTAMTGCAIIVDEYSLPVHMKSTTLISVSEVEDDDNGVKDVQEEVYFYDKLVFRLLGNSSDDRDRFPSESRMQYTISSDEIVRKIAGNDFRSQEAVRNALCVVSTDACQKGEPPYNSTVLLTTMIDYCGFRIQVFSPLELDEPSTLLYGHAQSENIFVNALGDTDYQAVTAVSRALNLALSYEELLTCREPLNRRNPADATRVQCEKLSQDLQIHRCKDDRLYFFNFSNLLPPDFPRPDSNDINTRHLRPEFVSDYSNGRIDSQAVHADMGILLQDRSRSMTSALPVESPAARHSLEENSLNAWVKAAGQLHGKTIPEVVRLLDTLTALPMDSFGFTRFLHSYGVNMRYLGKIYKMSSMPHVKDMVLCEAIARSVKSLLGQTLRNIARKGRAETIIAEDRNRSQKEDFINHQQRILTSKTSAVVYVFNLVLGYGKATDDFWKIVLPKLLVAKFDLLMPLWDKKLLVYFPQLVQALEYHTNVYFSPGKVYEFCSPSQPEPLTEDDLVNYECTVKFELTYSGYFYRCQVLTEAFMASNMFAQAISALKIRLSTQNIYMRGMNKPSQRAKHQVVLTSYTLALCYYLNGQYELSRAMLRSVLDETRRNSVIRGRLLTLLMCIEFESNQLSLALQLFEAAKTCYVSALGDRHPVVSLLYCALSDMYFKIDALPHAKLLVYKALHFATKYLGDNHMVSAGYWYKAGAILLREELYVDAIHALKKSLNLYAHYSVSGAELGHEMSVCYHGLAIAEARLGNDTAAIGHCKKSLSISTANEKYITSHAASCLMLLAEEHEKQQDYHEALNLLTDAWAIVQAYSKDFILPKILVIIASRIFSVYINSQSMNYRMLLYSMGEECEDKKLPQSALDRCSAYIAQELIRGAPVKYITRVLNEVTDGAIGVLSTHSRRLIGGQKSVFGVPCPVLKRTESEELEDEEVALTEDFDDMCRDEKSDEEKVEVDISPPPLSIQVMMVLRMVISISGPSDGEG